MAAPNSSSLSLTREWIDGNSIQRLPPSPSSPQEDYVNLDFAEELYGTILDVFSKTWHLWAGRCTALNNRQVKEVLARLRLWGRDFRDGKLACILAQSDELRDTILELLCQIGKIIIKLLLGNGESTRFGSQEQAENLQSLLAKSKLITRLPLDSDDLSEDEDISIISEATSARLRRSVANQQTTGRCHSCNKLQSPVWRRGPGGAIKLCVACGLQYAKLEPKVKPQGLTGSSVSHETTAIRMGSTTSSPSEAEPSSDDEEPDMVESLSFHVGCLMDLVPSMEGSLAHLQMVKSHPAAPIRAPFSVSEPARPFVQNISDKFQRADTCLIERLGESNWQRFVTIRARMQQILCKTEPEAEVAKEITPISVFKQAPQSIFTPFSLFHDSGLGSSVPTMRAYAASTASHTSFVSSIATDGTSALRVPPTPKEVQTGEPFKCEICGHILSKIKNRIDWKIHIFADLQPYICTFEACEKKLVKFPTRKMWADHEFTEHRVLRSWCCPECSESFSAAHDLDIHLEFHHSEAFTPAQLPMVLSAAETRRDLPVQIQECPLCKVIPGTSQRNFVKHVGRHLEAIALATLPRETDDDSDQGSVASSDGSQPPPGLNFPVPSPSPPFFVPPDFCHRTSLDGRDRELKLLDQKLFKERRQNVTTPVLVHGEPGSGKTELVERYIQLNRTKFTGGVFWINYRSVEEVHHVLRCIALEYMTDYSPGPDIDLEALMVAVENWFEGFGNWLIILNDLPVWGNLTSFPGIAGARIFCPFRQQSSLIYISSSDRIHNSELPWKPDSLLVAPLGDIRDSSLELNIARSSTGKYQTSSIELDYIRHIPSGSGTIRPYTCKLLECRNLEGFTYPGGLRQHQRQVHLVTESDEDVPLGMARRLRSGNTKSTKHEKSHARPWKCSDVNCKYHEFGWASEKVRDRHVQETHMLSPPMYKCDYTSCDYESKRESHCKQHMKDFHRLVWVHSKSDKLQSGKKPPMSQMSIPDISRSEASSAEGQGGSTLGESSNRTTWEGFDGFFDNHRSFIEAEEKAYKKEAEDRIDHGETGLLMGALSCEVEGCGHMSWSVSEHTEHCEASHPDVLADMSSRLRSSTALGSDTLLKAQGGPKHASLAQKGAHMQRPHSMRGTFHKEEVSSGAESPFEKSSFGIRLPSQRYEMSSGDVLKKAPLTGLRSSPRMAPLKQQAESRPILETKGNEHSHQEASITPEQTQRSQRLLSQMPPPTQVGPLNKSKPRGRYDTKRPIRPGNPKALPRASFARGLLTLYEEDERLRCVCGQTDYSGPLDFPGPLRMETLEDTDELFVQCDTCRVWQHGSCVGVFSTAAVTDGYFCELCRRDLHVLATSHNGRKTSRYTPAQDAVLPGCSFDSFNRNQDLDQSDAQNIRALLASNHWTVPEQRDFIKLVTQYGADFLKISQVLGTKTESQVANQYLRETLRGNTALDQMDHQTNRPRPDTSSKAQDLEAPHGDKEPRYCYCHDHAYGEMITCDNKGCVWQRFHLMCIGMTQQPQDKWYCDECTEELAPAGEIY